MKIDKLSKGLFERLDKFNGNNRIISSRDNNIDNEDDDDYYIKTGTIPPRFQGYRHARWEKLDEWGKLTCEDTDETITQDELDFGLKRWLRKTPEQRYQEEREDRYFHELSCYMRGLSIINNYDKGCNDQRCIPECRFYPEHGRIEDEEVIQRYKEIVERYRQKNAIVEPPSPSEMVRLLTEVTAYLPTTD